MFNWTKFLFSRQKYFSTNNLELYTKNICSNSSNTHYFFSFANIGAIERYSANEHLQQRCSQGLIFFSENINANEHQNNSSNKQILDFSLIEHFFVHLY